jgi:hypothetical protein
MADCEKNVDEALPITPSMVAPSDLVWFTTADGSSLRRPWANFLQAKPDDKEVNVIDAGGDIAANTLNNGDFEVIIPEHIGYKTRVYRNYQPVPLDATKEQYRTYDILTGKHGFVPALSTDEFLIFQVI